RCPHPIDGANRLFPRLGPLPSSPGQPLGSGGVLSYANFRKTYWEPIFAALGLPYVTPHSARHTFISTLQAQGRVVGLVAKLAGHANANVTLGHYTQAVRGGEVAVNTLEGAYFGTSATAHPRAPAEAGKEEAESRPAISQPGDTPP